MKIRAVKSVLAWEESILSFWISAVFLAAGIISLFLPWKFILTWTGRIVVHGLLGPHMKIVDLTIRRKFRNKSVMRNFDHLKGLARAKREEALKLKAIKCLRFGKLITQVPEYNLSRHYDRPLPQSTARPWRGNLLAPKLDAAQWLPRQQLYGPMIPRGENEYLLNKEKSFKERERLVYKLETRLDALRASKSHGGGTLLTSQEQDNDQQTEVGHEVIPYVEAAIRKSLESRPSSQPPVASIIRDLQSKKHEIEDSEISIFPCGTEDAVPEIPGCTTSLVLIEEIVQCDTCKSDTLSMEEKYSEDKTHPTTSNNNIDTTEEDDHVDADVLQATSTTNNGAKPIDDAPIKEPELKDMDAKGCDEEGLEIIAFDPTSRKVGELSAIFRESANISIAYYRN